MVAVITGDIVNSRKRPASEWLSVLKEVLEQYGTSPSQWEIYRGDSFQVALSPKEGLLAAIHIKSAIKTIKDLDARMAIGIGEEEYRKDRITEANGSAYERSGDCFETMKKQHIAVKTSDPDLNEVLNLLLSLASLSMDSWSPAAAAVIKVAVENIGKTQNELSELLDRSQSSVSEVLNRGAFYHVMQVNEYYQKQLLHL